MSQEPPTGNQEGGRRSVRVLQRVLLNPNRLVKLIIAIAIIHDMDATPSVGSIDAVCGEWCLLQSVDDKLRPGFGRLPLKMFEPTGIGICRRHAARMSLVSAVFRPRL